MITSFLSPSISNTSKPLDNSVKSANSPSISPEDSFRYSIPAPENMPPKMRRRLLTEFEAIVFSHEFDHLEGVLFIDKARNIRKAGEE